VSTSAGTRQSAHGEVSRSATTHGSVFTRSAAIAALATAHTAAAAKTRMVENVQHTIIDDHEYPTRE
jgi:hypothetical protein